MKNKRKYFFPFLVVLIIWVIYSWIKGPTQQSIDSKFKVIESPLDEMQYLVRFYPGALLLSGETHFSTAYDKTPLEQVTFSLNGTKNQEVIAAIEAYYKPYMKSVIDTFTEYNLEIQQRVIDQMQLDIPADSTFDRYSKYTLEKDIWPNKKIVLTYNDTSYLALSLYPFEDINRKYEGAAPQDFNRFIEVAQRVKNSFQGELRAKILLTDTAESLPKIYEIMDAKGHTVIRDQEALNGLKTKQYEDTDFTIWYLRGDFLSTTFSIIVFFMILRYFKK